MSNFYCLPGRAGVFFRNKVETLVSDRHNLNEGNDHEPPVPLGSLTPAISHRE